MRSTISKLKNKVIPGLLTAVAVLATPVSAFAAEQVKINENLDPMAIGGKLLGLMFDAATILGGGLLIWGGIQFGMSFSQENPDQRSRALLQVIAGAIVVGIRIVLQTLGVIGK